MTTRLELNKWGSYLLTIHVSQAGRAGDGIELVISKSDYEKLKKLGVPTLLEEEE